MTDSTARERDLMEIGFGDGLAVEARFRGWSIPTDQTEKAGGGGTAPPPFDLFLAAIGTCSGYYALRFCRQRRIDTTGMRVTLEPLRDPASRRLARIRIALELPPGFPEKYRAAIARAVDQCPVKRSIVDPPQFEIVVERPESG